MNDYTILRPLNDVAHRRMYLVQHHITKCQYAMKIVQKAVQMAEMDNEVLVLRQLHHRNIVNLTEAPFPMPIPSQLLS